MEYEFKKINDSASGYTPTVEDFLKTGGNIPSIEMLKENGITKFTIMCFDTDSNASLGAARLSYDRIYLQFIPTRLFDDEGVFNKAFQVIRSSVDLNNPIENSLIPLFTSDLETYYVYRPIMDEFVEIDLSKDMRGLDSDGEEIEEYFDDYFDAMNLEGETVKDVLYLDDIMLADNYGVDETSALYKFKEFAETGIVALGFLYTGTAEGSIEKIQISYDTLLSFYPVDTSVKLVNGRVTPRDTVWYKYSGETLNVYSTDNGIYKINYFRKIGEKPPEEVEETGEIYGVRLVEVGGQYGTWEIIDRHGNVLDDDFLDDGE